MTDSHLEIAYWLVVKELKAPLDIPVARLKAALPEFLASTGTPAKAGAVIYNCLSDIAWDWPAWNNFAKKVGYESLQSIGMSIAKMRPVEILKSLSVAELKQLFRERSVEQAPPAPKDALVAALLKAIGKDAIPNMVLPFRQHLQEVKSEKCRKQMALHIAYRIDRVAHNMYRYEQLNHPDLLKDRPFWRFVWGGARGDIDAPKSCRKFNNKMLPYDQAKQVFPILPCDYLQCSCLIFTERREIKKTPNNGLKNDPKPRAGI